MSTSATRSCKLQCGYILKIIIILLATTGIILSYFSSNTCRFLLFETEAYNETIVSPAFNEQTRGWIGIFKSEKIIQDENEETSRCSFYDNLFLDAPNKVLFAIQLCAVIAPSLAFIAILISIFELLCCKFFGSFIAACALFLTASLFQIGTFGIFLIDSSFCFDLHPCDNFVDHDNDDEHGTCICEIGEGVYFSASCVFFFFSPCILLCCSPRPNSYLQNYNDMKKCDDLISVAPTNISPPTEINETINYDEVEAP